MNIMNMDNSRRESRENTNDGKKRTDGTNAVVSVIVPVYNASATLGSCLASLSAQTYSNLEFLLVDDCSTDNSLTLLLDYAGRHAGTGITVKVLRHERNRGVAAARNTALAHATGNYIYHVDADDFIESDTLECLVAEAERSDSDIVGHEWYLTFCAKKRYMRQPDYATPGEALRNMMCGVMRWNLWLFLVRHSLYTENHIHFKEGADMGEDLMVMVRLFASAKKVTSIHRPFYHYGRQNRHSLTETYSQEHIRQVTDNVSEVERVVNTSPYACSLSAFLPFLKLTIKLPLLITDDESHYEQWLEWFPEVNGCVMKNKRLPFRTRLLQWMAVKRHFLFLKLYYRTVFKLVYGMIYK